MLCVPSAPVPALHGARSYPWGTTRRLASEAAPVDVLEELASGEPDAETIVAATKSLADARKPQSS